MRFQRRQLVSIVGPVAALMLGYMASHSFGGHPPTIEVDIDSSINAGPVKASPDDRAASFAARAVADAGLTDDAGRLFDYLKTLPTDDSWTSTFENGGCVDASCDVGAQEPLRVTVEQVTVDRFRISDVEGPVLEEDRAKLLLYQERNGDPPSGWTFPAVEVDDTMGRISGSPVWEGTINAAGVGSKCSPVIRNETGAELWRGDPFDLGPPGDEEERAGENVLFPVLPQDLQRETPAVECTSWTGSGWQLEEPAVAHRQDEGTAPGRGANVAVTARARWAGDSFMQAFTECVALLRDRDGNVVSTATETLTSPPPQPDSERPVVATRGVEIFARTADPGAVRRVDMECRPITADEFQGEER